ncbi:hypothetical protein AVEN_231826-1 [Araneus ventricosus]|uniref:Uncharacterized protein n=1 Tax=Araneus ventricosus TaxID=182803 RepID=A0A4Y2P2B2_ARAVE|nr:hypothetical protein AVEN_231826-1 [Araneus ventricosus]
MKECSRPQSQVYLKNYPASVSEYERNCQPRSGGRKELSASGLGSRKVSASVSGERCAASVSGMRESAPASGLGSRRCCQPRSMMKSVQPPVSDSGLRYEN